MANKKINIILVGGGKGCCLLLNIFKQSKMLNIMAVIDIDKKAPCISIAKEQGIAVDTSYEKILTESKIASKVDEIINVTGSNIVQQHLEGIKSKKATVMDGNSAKLMWELVEEHKRAEGEIKLHMKELERINKFMTGREYRILELKAEINELLAELGRKPKYAS